MIIHRLPECEKLPRLEGGNNTCTRTGITDMRWDLATSKMTRMVVMVVMVVMPQ